MMNVLRMLPLCLILILSIDSFAAAKFNAICDRFRTRVMENRTTQILNFEYPTNASEITQETCEGDDLCVMFVCYSEWISDEYYFGQGCRAGLRYACKVDAVAEIEIANARTGTCQHVHYAIYRFCNKRNCAKYFYECVSCKRVKLIQIIHFLVYRISN